MTDKQLINSTENCVEESLYGFSKLHPNLSVDFGRKIVTETTCCNNDRVALVSGGGSGHEPFPAGYVGSGMLTASVSGSIFVAPPSRQILHCIRSVASKSSGVLLLVPNYTGDVLNFGMAEETARSEAIRVESVVVGEDVAQEVRGATDEAGKRGMCGLVLIIKIAGYLAVTGHDLETIKRYSVEVLRSTASMGLCVSACCKPGVGLLFQLGKDEMEVGVGVHGEAGVSRMKLLPAREAVEMLLLYVLRSLSVAEGDEVVALLNNLGSLSLLEQWLLAGELEARLSERKIKVVRLYAGCFFTSLNMAGAQICIMKLSPETKMMVLAALDYPTTAPAWKNARESSIQSDKWKEIAKPLKLEKDLSGRLPVTPKEAEFLKRCLLRISVELRKEETCLNYLDSICGDGDCGTTFKHLAILVEAFANRLHEFSDFVTFFFDLSSAIQESVGGTTGALYGLFFRGCGQELSKHENLNEAFVFSKCWRAGVESIKKYTSARIGDRTMLDSLETGCQVFENQLKDSALLEEAFKCALKAATEGCANTKFLKPKAGRAKNADPARQTEVDAGAYAVTVWLSAIQKVLDESERQS